MIILIINKKATGNSKKEFNPDICHIMVERGNEFRLPCLDFNHTGIQQLSISDEDIAGMPLRSYSSDLSYDTVPTWEVSDPPYPRTYETAFSTMKTDYPSRTFPSVTSGSTVRDEFENDTSFFISENPSLLPFYGLFMLIQNRENIYLLGNEENLV